MKTRLQWQPKVLAYQAAFYMLNILLLIKSDLVLAVETRDTDKITINLLYKQHKPGDSLRLYLSDVFAYNKNAECFYPKENNDKSLRFEIPVKESCGYFTFHVKRRTGPGDMMIIEDQFWEAGDSLTVKVSHRETNAGVYSISEFSGKGAVKYTLWNKMNQIKMVQMQEPKPFLGNILEEPLPTLEVTRKLQLSFLEQNKGLISNVVYGVFKAQLLADELQNNLYSIKTYFENKVLKGDDGIRKAFTEKFKKLYFPINPYRIEDAALAQSKDYIFRIEGVFNLYALMEKGKEEPDFIYKAIIEHSSANVREAVLLTYFLSAGNNNKMGHLYKDAEKYMLSSERLMELKELAARSSELLEDYSFKDINGKVIRISDFKNKVVLIDVYFWGCGGCALYYRDVLSKLEKQSFIGKDVIILSVSYDRTMDRWKRGLKEGIYTSDKAINVYAGEALGYKHPFITKQEIVALPTPMLIDRQGRIVNFKTGDLKTYDGLMKEIKKYL